MRRKLLGTVAALALIGAATGCTNFELLASKHNHHYGNDDNKRRISELESRVECLEKEVGICRPDKPKNCGEAPGCPSDAACESSTK